MLPDSQRKATASMRREFERDPPLILKSDQQDLRGFRRTDLGNAEKFAEWYGDRLKYCPGFNSWLEWDGRRWKRDTTGAAFRSAGEFVRRLYAEASKFEDDQRRKELASWAIRCEDRRKLENMLALAKNLSAFVVAAEDLDTDPFALNVLDGTLDLRTGKLRLHDPEDRITRLAPVAFGAQSASTQFHRFLRRIFGDGADMIRFVQRALGYSLTGDVSEQVMFVAYGTGANGKSTLLGLFQSILGDYALSTPADTLLAKRNSGGIPSDVARLRGARFVTAQETEDGLRLGESAVKALTGGDVITARRLYGEWHDFQPNHKLWLATNHKPEIRGTDHAIWRRIRLIPFTVAIADDERDPSFWTS